MKTLIIFIICIVLSHSMKSYKLRGIITDDNNNYMPFTYITISNMKNNLLEEGGTNLEGEYYFAHIECNPCIIRVTYPKYKEFVDTIDLKKNIINELDIVMLKVD